MRKRAIENSKVKSYIGFAIKSGKALFGADSISETRKRMYLIIVDNTINRTSMNRLVNIASERIKLIALETGLMNEITGISNCKAIAICDSNLAKAIIDNIGAGVNE